MKTEVLNKYKIFDKKNLKKLKQVQHYTKHLKKCIKICWENPNLVKFGHNCRVVYVQS